MFTLQSYGQPALAHHINYTQHQFRMAQGVNVKQKTA